jgi:hypothetical protein
MAAAVGHKCVIVPAVGNLQPDDPETKVSGAKLGSASFSPVRARLSAAIYKICTLLSTAIVENPLAPEHATGPEALLGAVFRGVAAFP